MQEWLFYGEQARAIISIKDFLDRKGNTTLGYAQPFELSPVMEKAVACLIYCAKNRKKIAYKTLAQKSGMPEVYATGFGLMWATGHILGLIGKYCEAIEVSHLNALCVNYVSGLPSAGCYPYIAEEVSKDIKSEDDCKNAINVLYKSLEKYDWTTVVEINNLKLSEITSSSLLEQDGYVVSSKDISKYANEEEKTIVDKSIEAMELEPAAKNIARAGKISAVFLLLLGLVILYCLIGNYPVESKGNVVAYKDLIGSSWLFGISWLLWIPLCFVLWSLGDFFKSETAREFISVCRGKNKD